MVAIARALSFEAQVVILDEPTAALSQHEIVEFYQIVERLKREGKAILFISHKFDEIFAIADHYTILRDGVISAPGKINDISEEHMVTMMVGREITHAFPKVNCEPGEVVFEVKISAIQPNLPIQLLASQRGNSRLLRPGRRRAYRTDAGAVRVFHARLTVKSCSTAKRCSSRQPSRAIKAGIVCVPEERQKQGAIIDLPIYQNISLPQLSRLNPRGVFNDKNEWALADEYAKRLQVKAFSWKQPVETLSGGNQQKVVIGKWLATQPDSHHSR